MRRVSWRTPAFVGILGFAALAAPAAPSAPPAVKTAPSEPPYGIDHRVLWTTSHVVGSPNPPPPYRVVRAFPKLTFNQPLYVVTEPGTDDMLVISHDGGYEGPAHIVRLKNRAEADKTEPFLDMNRIAYGLAFHPDYAKNGYVYVGSNGPDGDKVKMDRVSRFTVDRKPPYRCDPKSEVVVLEWASNGHNGGDLGFGPDGYLYVTSGDGTSDSDGDLRGQDLTHLTAKVLRIDVDHPADGKPYSVPKDNPFVDRKGACPETWAYGMRNPWRMTFDRKTGRLWVGQNGQDLWEQVYVIHKGDNCGWSVNEGSHPFQPERSARPRPDRDAGRRAPPFRVPFADRRRRLLRVEISRFTGRLHLRRLLHGGDLGGPSRRDEDAFGRGVGGLAAANRRLRHRPRRRTVDRGPRRRPIHPGADAEGEAGAALPHEAERNRRFHLRQGSSSGPRPDPLRRERPALVRRRRQGALHRPARRRTDRVYAPGAVGISRKGRCWSRRSRWTWPATPPRRAAASKPGCLPSRTGSGKGIRTFGTTTQTDAELVPAEGADRVYEVRDAGRPGGSRKQTWHYPAGPSAWCATAGRPTGCSASPKCR